VAALNSTNQQTDLTALVDFTYYPFGNAYWVNVTGCEATPEANISDYPWAVTDTSPPWGYNLVTRQCFNTQCGPSNDAPPADCYSNEVMPYCQHGELECIINRVEDCARTQVQSNWAAVDFLVCMEEQYDSLAANAQDFTKIDAAITQCAGSLDAAAIQGCYNSQEGFQYQQVSAKNTPAHDGVPYLLVNGQSLQTPSFGSKDDPILSCPDFLSRALCSVLSDPPASCTSEYLM